MSLPIRLRAPLPGECMRFSATEAHAIFSILRRMEDEPRVPKYGGFSNLYGMLQRESVVQMTPIDRDRTFFEIIVKGELRVLKTHYMMHGSCMHSALDHVNVLRAWLAREIELPKKFASFREAIAKLPASERIFGGPFLSRDDAQALIEEEIERQRVRMRKIDMKDLDYYESLSEAEREEFANSLQRAHEATLKNAREELWVSLKKRYTILD